jgi:LacI family transcriptional regulator
MKRITITDIAKSASVSYSTVSRALRRSSVVNEKTRENIIKIAEEMNYIPNSFAEFLKTKKSNLIGIVIPDLSNPFFSEILKTIVFELKKHNYSLLIDQSGYEESSEKNIIIEFLKKNAEGVIVFPSTEILKFESTITNSQIPAVLIDFKPIENQYMSSIYVNHGRAVKGVINYMISLNHKDIGFIAGPKDYYATGYSLEGYKEALMENNIRLREDYIYFSNNTPEDAYFRTIKMLKEHSHITALFLFGDNTAIGVYRAIKEAQMEIPRDISIISYDDVYYSRLMVPALSTISFPKKEAGVSAVNLILEMINGKISKKDIELEVKLILRDSCIANNS